MRVKVLRGENAGDSSRGLEVLRTTKPAYAGCGWVRWWSQVAGAGRVEHPAEAGFVARSASRPRVHPLAPRHAEL